MTQPSLAIHAFLIRTKHYHTALIFALVRELIFQNRKLHNKVMRNHIHAYVVQIVSKDHLYIQYKVFCFVLKYTYSA